MGCNLLGDIGQKIMAAMRSSGFPKLNAINLFIIAG